MWWEQSGALHPAVGQTRKLQVFFFFILAYVSLLFFLVILW